MRERVREHKWGEAERERHRIRSRLQAPSCRHRARCVVQTQEPRHCTFCSPGNIGPEPLAADLHYSLMALMETEPGRQMIWCRFCPNSTEPDAGLELTNHEIMT